ncbi:hypothetical protein C8Q74DRAFT_1308970 [Fomes fomentarius]|nr:hypothetical protein C8Q74DRAFT_1308970 [Fomes fomentarius]
MYIIIEIQGWPHLRLRPVLHLYQNRALSMERDARHDALLCLDILIPIFEQFDNSDLRCKAACANAALACRTFAAVALPVLWRQPNLFPLLYILAPTDVQQPPKLSSIDIYAYEERDSFADMILVSKRYLDEACWGVFSYHALELITRNGGATFLPALQRLFWSQAPFSGLTLTSLSCTSLVELYVRFVDEGILDRDSHELSRHLPIAFPSLQNSVFVSHLGRRARLQVLADTGDRHNPTLRSISRRSRAPFQHIEARAYRAVDPLVGCTCPNSSSCTAPAIAGASRPSCRIGDSSVVSACVEPAVHRTRSSRWTVHHAAGDT